MATIKSYTDLEQSRKLADILPLESADMYYYTVNGDLYKTPNIIESGDDLYVDEKSIPCWSLAALFGVIPQEIFDGEYIINITEGLNNRWMLTYNNYEIGNHSFYGLSTGADNLVDACVDIIIKLKERNII